MGLLLDTVNDARRPLPSSGLVLRRSVAAEFDSPFEDTNGSADPGAFTVYRLQKEGGSPPVAPLQGPSTLGQGAPHGATGSEGVVDSIVHPLVSRKDGLERGEKITREVHAQDVLSNQRLGSSSVSPVLSGAQSPGFSASVSSLIATSDEKVVPVVANAPAQRRYGRTIGSQVASGAPSEDLSDKTATVKPLNAVAAIDTIEAQAFTTKTAARSDAATSDADTRRFATTHVHAQPAPASRARTPTTGSEFRNAVRPERPGAGGLHIGRIDVTVLAQTPRPATAAPTNTLFDNQFLSRNYLRRT